MTAIMKKQGNVLGSAEVTFCRYASPLGSMLIAARAQGLAGIWFDGQKHFAGAGSTWRERSNSNPGSGVLAQTVAALEQYFEQSSQTFTIALAPSGTDFQQRVWDELVQIPYGATLSYGDIAKRLGAPTAARAVAAAIGRNPISIVIPCHRVVGANGSLTGYAGGLERKRALLALEGQQGALSLVDLPSLFRC